MKRTQVYIPDDLYEQAQRYAQLNHENISQFLRRGLQAEIQVFEKKKMNKNPLSALVGKFEAEGDTDAAINHDDMYSVS